jgi:hypothetical protein
VCRAPGLPAGSNGLRKKAPPQSFPKNGQDSGWGTVLCMGPFQNVRAVRVLFLAGVADHLYMRNRHMAVLSVVFLHVGIGGSVLCILLEVMGG